MELPVADALKPVSDDERSARGRELPTWSCSQGVMHDHGMTSFDPIPQSRESAEVQIDAAVRCLIGLLARQAATEFRTSRDDENGSADEGVEDDEKE